MMINAERKHANMVERIRGGHASRKASGANRQARISTRRSGDLEGTRLGLAHDLALRAYPNLRRVGNNNQSTVIIVGQGGSLRALTTSMNFSRVDSLSFEYATRT